MGKKITEDYNSSTIETLDGLDFAIGVDKSELKVCVIPMSQIKGYIIGIGVGIGTNTPGDIVTTDDSQELTNKTLTIPKISAAEITGDTTIADGAILTTPVISQIKTATNNKVTIQDAEDTLVGRDTTDTLTKKTLTSPVLNTPDINGGTIDGAIIDDTTTVEISEGVNVAVSTLVDKTSSQTLTHKTLTSPTINGATIAGTVTIGNGSTLTTPVVTNPAVTYGTFDTPAITNGTIDGADITGATIDGTTLLAGTSVTNALAAKPNLDTQTTHCCTLTLNNGATTSDTVDEAEIFAALGLTAQGITAASYNIIASTMGITLWHNNTTYDKIPIDNDTGVNAKITKTGTGTNALLTQIDFTNLTASETYYVALTFKLVAAA